MIKPIKDRLILRPNDSFMRGTIFIPEQYTDASTSCLVVAKGNKVSSFIKEKDIVLCEVGFGSRQAKDFDNRDFWAKEENIYAVIRNRKIYPLGQRVLIRRDIEDEYKGSIVIPANRRYQSLTGTIERIGLTKKPLRINDIKVGDSIKLVEWMEHYIEVELEDNSYGLIVNDTDLLYKQL